MSHPSNSAPSTDPPSASNNHQSENEAENQLFHFQCQVESLKQLLKQANDKLKAKDRTINQQERECSRARMSIADLQRQLIQEGVKLKQEELWKRESEEREAKLRVELGLERENLQRLQTAQKDCMKDNGNLNPSPKKPASDSDDSPAVKKAFVPTPSQELDEAQYLLQRERQLHAKEIGDLKAMLKALRAANQRMATTITPDDTEEEEKSMQEKAREVECRKERSRSAGDCGKASDCLIAGAMRERAQSQEQQEREEMITFHNDQRPQKTSSSQSRTNPNPDNLNSNSNSGEVHKLQLRLQEMKLEIFKHMETQVLLEEDVKLKGGVIRDLVGKLGELGVSANVKLGVG